MFTKSPVTRSAPWTETPHQNDLRNLVLFSSWCFSQLKALVIQIVTSIVFGFSGIRIFAFWSTRSCRIIPQRPSNCRIFNDRSSSTRKTYKFTPSSPNTNRNSPLKTPILANLFARNSPRVESSSTEVPVLLRSLPSKTSILPDLHGVKPQCIFTPPWWPYL